MPLKQRVYTSHPFSFMFILTKSFFSRSETHLMAAGTSPVHSFCIMEDFESSNCCTIPTNKICILFVHITPAGYLLNTNIFHNK